MTAMLLLVVVYAGCFIAAAIWLMGYDRRPRLLAALGLDAVVGVSGVLAVLAVWPAQGAPLGMDMKQASLLWVAAVLAGSVAALASGLAVGAREERVTTETTVAGALGAAMVAACLGAAAGIVALMAGL